MSDQIHQKGLSRRDKAVAMAMKRKEEYLGARVPKELRDKVIQSAKEMGVPVSILIRNILEDAFREGLLQSQAEIAKSSQEKIAEQSKDKFAMVLGWEKITLNKSVSCASCGVQLTAGSEVTLGLGGVEPIVLCDACKRRT